MPTEQVADAGGGHPMAELEQLAVYPHVDPERVLIRQPEHQLLALSRPLRPPRPRRRPNAAERRRTCARCQPRMVARLHQEQGAGRQPAAERGQDHAMGSLPARPSGCASEDEQFLAEDEQFLAEDEEFEIAIGTRSTTDDENVDQHAG